MELEDADKIAPAKLFTHREFAFTLTGDIYIRYNSFNTAEDFKKEVCRLNPSRFEIGPQYTARVRPLILPI
jgi:DNA primase small subunit